MPEVDYMIDIDDEGFVWFEGVRLPVRFVVDQSSLEFLIKDRRVISEINTRFVNVPIDAIIQLNENYNPTRK
jgi:hypothetical protein